MQTLEPKKIVIKLTYPNGEETYLTFELSTFERLVQRYGESLHDTLLDWLTRAQIKFPDLSRLAIGNLVRRKAYRETAHLEEDF